MLIHTPQCTSTLVRVGAVLAFLITCGSFFLPSRYSAATTLEILTNPGSTPTERSSTFSATVVEFWQDVAAALLISEPQTPPLQVTDERIQNPEDKFDPLATDRKNPDRLVNFKDEDETALLRAHYSMRSLAQKLAPKVPYSKETTGIVTTANGLYMPVLLVSLRMLRRTGCKLPVEVFIDDWATYDKTACDVVLPSLNARCVVLENIYNKASGIKKPDHFQYKILAILFSTFQHVLFLDSDAFPIYDPTVLFETAPYTTHGLVTWPDYFAITVSSHFYHIAAIPPEPVSTRYSTESGQLLLNKNIHRESLLMMVYYNYYGPDYYYPLLCQGSHGTGDKETFVQAALAVNLPYYQVRSGPQVVGRWIGKNFRGSGIAQADPGLDYEYLPPHPNHLHASTKWEKEDTAHPDAAIEKKLNITRHVPPPPRPVFLHQNSIKMDPEKLLVNKEDGTFEPDGMMHRMWGSKEDMERMLGFDVERRLWDVVAEEACRLDQASDKCKRTREYVVEVFGWMDSIDRPW